MIQIAIVEDESAYANQLKEFIERYEKENGEEVRLTFYTDGEDIIEVYDSQFDIILMDIQMRFMDGMTAAEKIRKTDPNVVIMFITNMLQYAIRGYQVDALDYVVKPVTYFDFSQKLSRAIKRIPEKHGFRIQVKTISGVVRIRTEDIYYLASEGHTLNFYTKVGHYSERGKMQDREDELREHGFYRINKGYLVNLKYVDGIRDGCCLIAGEELLIARVRKAEFLSVLTSQI